MASTLRILPEIETKSLVCEGIIAVREAVALTVVMPSGAMDDGDDIRVRIRGPRGDVARFPLEDDDAWETSADEAGNTILSATLNCATDELVKVFRFVPENGKLPFFVTVENETRKCLCARGRVKILNWAGDGGSVSIESERVSAADIRKAVENIPTDYSNQREIGLALANAVRALKDFGLCVVAAFALTASAMEWQDVPATTVIGEGLTVTNGEIRAAGGGLDGQAVTNIVEGVVADATNGMVKVENGQVLLDDAEISAAGATLGSLAVGGLRAGGAAAYYGGDGDEYELAVKGDIPDLNNYTGNIHTGGSIDAGEISVQGASVATLEDISGFAVRTNLPPISATATVGDLVDAYNGIVNALKEEP